MQDSLERDMEAQRASTAIDIARAVAAGERPDVFKLAAFALADVMLSRVSS